MKSIFACLTFIFLMLFSSPAKVQALPSHGVLPFTFYWSTVEKDLYLNMTLSDQFIFGHKFKTAATHNFRSMTFKCIPINSVVANGKEVESIEVKVMVLNSEIPKVGSDDFDSSIQFAIKAKYKYMHSANDDDEQEFFAYVEGQLLSPWFTGNKPKIIITNGNERDASIVYQLGEKKDKED